MSDTERLVLQFLASRLAEPVPDWQLPDAFNDWLAKHEELALPTEAIHAALDGLINQGLVRQVRDSSHTIAYKISREGWTAAAEDRYRRRRETDEFKEKRRESRAMALVVAAVVLPFLLATVLAATQPVNPHVPNPPNSIQ